MLVEVSEEAVPVPPNTPQVRTLLPNFDFFLPNFWLLFPDFDLAPVANRKRVLRLNTAMSKDGTSTNQPNFASESRFLH